jgi:hypothetical protein
LAGNLQRLILRQREKERRLHAKTCRACSHPRHRGSLWCREHYVEVYWNYKRGELSWEAFVMFYGVDPDNGLLVGPVSGYNERPYLPR